LAHRIFYGIHEVEKVTKMATKIELTDPLISFDTGRRYWWIAHKPYFESKLSEWPTEHFMAYMRWKKLQK
jgi:hypothetical protein